MQLLTKTKNLDNIYYPESKDGPNGFTIGTRPDIEIEGAYIPGETYAYQTYDDEALLLTAQQADWEEITDYVIKDLKDMKPLILGIGGVTLFATAPFMAGLPQMIIGGAGIFYSLQNIENKMQKREEFIKQYSQEFLSGNEAIHNTKIQFSRGLEDYLFNDYNMRAKTELDSTDAREVAIAALGSISKVPQTRYFIALDRVQNNPIMTKMLINLHQNRLHKVEEFFEKIQKQYA